MAVDAEQLAKVYRSRYSGLRNVQSPFIPLWTDIRNFLAPRTARFQGEQVNSAVRQDLNIINSSPRDAVRTLAAGMQSGVTSPMRPWFRLGLPDPQLQEFAPVKLWLFLVERLMRDVLTRSNIYDRLKSNYATLGTYGTSALFIDEDEERVMRAQDFPIGSFMIATGASGRVNTMYRDVSFSASQMMERFGADKVPSIVKSAYDNGNYDNLYPVCHIIEPNRNYIPGSALTQYKKFASVYFDPSQQGDAAILSYKGYDDLPFMASRWDVLGEDDYGFGCGEMALGDSKQMQLMEKRKLQGIDKNVNPPMIGDASMRNQRTSNMPGETTYVNGLITGNPGYRPAYQVNPYISELREEIAAVNQRVDVAFYKNLFLMVSEIADQPNITATQINTMREEKLLMLGPVLERLNDDLLDPLITRIFNLMNKNGMLPPPPPEIQGMPLRVEYISVLAQAQKAMGIGNIERFIGFVGNLAAATQNPEVWDKVDTDQSIDEYADGVAVPPTLVRTDEAVQQLRQSRQQQQQTMQATALAQQGAEAAKTLSETNMQGDNALTRALGVAGAPA